MLLYANICQYPILSDTSITFYSTVHVYMLLPACIQYNIIKYYLLQSGTIWYLLSSLSSTFFLYTVFFNYPLLPLLAAIICYLQLSATATICYYLWWFVITCSLHVVLIRLALWLHPLLSNSIYYYSNLCPINSKYIYIYIYKHISLPFTSTITRLLNSRTICSYI